LSSIWQNVGVAERFYFEACLRTLIHNPQAIELEAGEVRPPDKVIVPIIHLAEARQLHITPGRPQVGRLAKQPVRSPAEPGVERLFEVEQVLPGPATLLPGGQSELTRFGREAIPL
jgi:hypothetical protein